MGCTCAHNVPCTCGWQQTIADKAQTVGLGQPEGPWREVAQIAGALMAGGHYTTVRFAIKQAREIVAAAREGERS